MRYAIKYDTIKPILEEEVSREAAQAHSAEGVSLYDALKITSRDEEKNKRLLEQVLAAIKEQCNRFICCANFSGTPPVLTFDLDVSSRRTMGREEIINTLLQNVTVNTFLSKYFLSKNAADLSTKYGEQAAADVQALNKVLYTKMPPKACF